ncbi:Multidrug resistance protein MdtA [Defluviimonas aquaemixtae]|uniref:Multidrug resistance protein MdtA n=1 Tax=Albidovulum aquaemixtae TaxID=1542388 RepID=A0A2R8BJ59_9RHOB|nr:efflux RND transporter periplasmic adaptor subunit [Defluviimonas aquaemixtae]SPH23330.1 Multidrug resistance protein MdtA [Defluviimonas aquaemixtae]
MTRFALCLATILALPATAEEAEQPSGAAPRPVVSVVVQPEAELPLTYVGTVASRIETDLGFPLIGTIAERPISAGDVVQRDEILARLDPEALDADLRAAEAGVAVAEAQLRSAADATDRARSLAETGAGSETRLEDAERALVAAEARLEQARASLASAQDTRDLATLTAPQDGVVTEIFAEPGATLSAGQPVLRLAATDAREIVIDLSEQDVAALEPGVEFQARLAANPAVTATATLRQIDPVAERTTRTRRLHLALKDAPDSFRLGALVRVTPLSGSDAGVVLPAGAVLDSDGPSPSVWRVDRADNQVERVPVTLGPRVGDYIVVTSGLSPGTEVVVKGIHSLEEGQIVGPRVPG